MAEYRDIEEFRRKRFEFQIKQAQVAIAFNEQPTCPACGEPMVPRIARVGPNAGKQFWGCSGFPDCRFTLESSPARA